MGDKEEAENDRRKLMNKIFCSALTAVVAGAMLTGCAMPWEKGADDDVAPGGYSYTADSNSEQKQAYRWLIEPTINADNIISFDGSQVDPNNEKNTAYANYSVIRQNGKYGIIDYSGNMVVPAEYDDYYTCWCGEVTLFNIINEKNDEYEYCSIDSSNQVVYYAAEHHDSSPRYYWNSNEEKIYVKDADEEQGEEYTGKKAVVVCEADVKKSDNGFYDISPVSEPLYGLAKKDKLILDMQYTDFYAPAYKGAGLTCIAFENDEGKWGYVGSDGKTIIDFKCDGDMSAYCGKVIDDEMAVHPYLFTDDYLPVSIDSSYGYYDIDGNCIVKPGEFDQARPAHNGKAWVMKSGKWGVIAFGDAPVEEDSSEEETTTTTTTTSYITTTTTSTTTKTTSVSTETKKATETTPSLTQPSETTEVSTNTETVTETVTEPVTETDPPAPEPEPEPTPEQ
ncbi:WG repeat-containing protein [Ruminococcus sp. AF19-15]|nr:WG repeat-containing protein [Ruminococcus sp. AF19-15]